MMNKNKSRALALLFCFCLCFANNLLAQKFFFRHYTVTDGLCANTIWDIEQDDQGYMWFGTKYGLSRFDGYNFKSFQHQKGVAGTIGNNFIRKIFRYDPKTFWIGTDEGIFIFNLETEKFTPFKPLQNYFINDIIRTSDGEVWIATKEKGIYRYQPKTGRVKNFTTSSAQKISSNEVSKLVEDDLGNIWVGTYGKGIDVLRPQGDLIRHYSSATGSLSSNVILDLYKDKGGNIWIGTMGGGLNVWQKKLNAFKVYARVAGNSISDNIVRSIFEPRPGILYLGTEKGLNIFDLKNGRFSVYQNKNNDPFSISDDAVYNVFKDKDGGLWAGTYFGGLNYYHETSLSFEFYYPSGVRNSLSGNAISAFLETKPGSMWVGTEDEGLNYFNTVDKTFKRFPFSADQDSLSYHNIHALYKDKKGHIWIGMYTGGLNILNPKTGKIKRFKSDPNDPKTLSDNSVYSIDEDRQGRVWVSTIAGLNRYDDERDCFIRIKGKNLDKSCIYQVYQDKDQVVWIATYDNGLIRMDKNGKLSQYAYSTNPNSISSNKVICMLDDDEGNLWLGTDGSGLNVLSKHTGKFKIYNGENWIKSAVIYGIIKDDLGKMWFSTNNGLFEFDPKSKTMRSFGKWDNLQSQQYNYKAFYKDSSGKMYFGGINGFNAFYPSQVRTISSAPKISFTNFQLFNKDLSIAEEGPLKKSINYTREITLSHNQSVLSIEYAALSFIAPNKIQYAFKMDGFDKNWNYVGSQRKATYTNLPAGTYTFMVREADGQRLNKEQVSTIKINILPPFYKTVYAYIVYILLLAFVLVWLRKFIYNKERKRNEIKLERLKNKSEQDFYKQKIEFFTAMAHEIRTPLSLIIAPLERLLSKKQKDQESTDQLQVMEENSDRLLTLVNQLLDFRRIESDIFEIHPETVELVYLVNSIRDRFYPMAEKRNLGFSISSNFKQLDVFLDPEAIMKILSNLLINAFKFARRKLRISINDFHISPAGEKMISISIEDDGIGIPGAQLDSIFKKFFKVSSEEHHYTNLGGTGIGLALAKSLTEKHGGELKVESEENVRTIFTVLIPFQESINALEPAFAAVETDDVEGQQTVLVVEDDPALLDFLYKSFLAEGYHAVKAKNGADAFKKLDKNHIDIVISDVMMPVMDGIELCKTIKNDINFSHLPVILLTAKTNTEAEIQGLESGADAYVSKPFKWKQLSLIIKNLLELQSNLKLRFAQNPFESTDILISGNRDKKFLDKITQIIQERISDPQLSVEDLGKELGISRSSLYKKVKAKTGYVPNEFVRLIRLKAAAKLLTEQEFNISEIGYMVGFSSHSYFSKCFYSQFKLTPSEFSENYKKNGTVES
jgi:ligand-binding sensor domain-containing protein/signal transduction histidine kinase/AraC-like DNA-binding protein